MRITKGQSVGSAIFVMFLIKLLTMVFESILGVHKR
jgi:hypothetical protein